MMEPIVADAGPLIGLARIGLQSLLRDLYGKVLIPPTVLEELQLSSGRADAQALSIALNEGWLVLDASAPRGGFKEQILDPGETEALALAEHRGARLLIDERRGRAVAKARGIRVIGTGGMLIIAKERGRLERVDIALDQLAGAGYRLSPELRNRLIQLAGEI